MTPQDRRQAVTDALAERNPEAVLWNGLDDALVGIASQFTSPPLAVYDQERLVHLLQDQGMTWEEAHEYLAHNIAGGYLGAGTPLILEGVGDLGP